MTIEKDRTMFGTKILNHETKEVALLIYTWTNKFADGEIPYATCVDMHGKKYNIELDLISPIDD